MEMKHLTGLVAASHTPMRDDGSVNIDVIEQQARLFSANRILGAFICGTTGEGKLLTLDERKRIAERWTGVADRNLAVIVHVGCDSLEESKTLAAHAQKNGAYATAAVGPSFFKPAGIDDLVRYCEAVASAAPEIPFYYYHLPTMTGLYFSMIDFLERAADRIPNLAGIKFTSEDLMDLTQCLHYEDGRFDILFGRDEILLAGLALGARGAVGSTYNYAAPLYHQIIDAYERGDIPAARDLQRRSQEIVRIIRTYNEIAIGKAIVTMLGVDCGPVRLPLRSLTADQRQQILSELETQGLLPYLSKFE